MKKRILTFRRRGSIIHEAAIAIVLCGVVLMSVAQIMTLSAQQSRSRLQRLAATREAGNLMEQLMARSWEKLTPESTAAIELSAACRATLPDARLAIGVAPDGETSKQLTIEIRWHQNAGIPEAPVRLTAWKYALEEAVQ